MDGTKQCQEYEPLVERMLSDEISGDEMDRLLSHAETCGDCREFVELHHRMLGPELDTELPTEGEFAAMRHTVMRRLRAEQSSARGRALGTLGLLWALMTRPAFVAGTAVLMLVMLGAGVVVGQRSGFTTYGGAEVTGLTRVDPVLMQIRTEARGNRELVDVENSPYVYSNVSFQNLNNRQIALSFDVTRHVELKRFENDPLVKEILVQSLLNPSSIGTRLQAMSHAERVMDPKIKQAMIFSMLNDPDLPVRLKALKILCEQEPDAEIQDGLMIVLGEEESVQMRMLAMGSLVRSNVESERMERLLEDLGAQGERALLMRAADYTGRPMTESQ